MARDGSGNYNLPSPENPVVAGTTIDATDHNTTMTDVAAALTQSMSKDGQTVATGNLPMGGFRHTNVGNATARNQYGTVASIQDDTYNALTGVSGTNTITASATPAISAYVDKQNWIFVPFASNTGAATLNINSVAARSIVNQDGTALAAGDLVAGVPAHVVYDLANTRWILTNPNVYLMKTAAIGGTVQAWDADLDALAALSGTGIMVRTGAQTYNDSRSIAGTASRVSVTNGDGVAGNPTIDIDAAYVGQASITTLGTITTGTWQGTTVAVNQGGTGTTTSTGTGSVVLSDSPTFTTEISTEKVAGNTIEIEGNNASVIRTQNRSGTTVTTGANSNVGATTGAQVIATSGQWFDVGMNQMWIFNSNVSDTLEAGHCGTVSLISGSNSRTLTLETFSSTDFPVGGVTTLLNLGTGTYTVTEGASTTLWAQVPGTGAVDTAGGCTIGPGGSVTIWRQQVSVYYIWGSEITP